MVSSSMGPQNPKTSPVTFANSRYSLVLTTKRKIMQESVKRLRDLPNDKGDSITPEEVLSELDNFTDNELKRIMSISLYEVPLQRDEAEFVIPEKSHDLIQKIEKIKKSRSPFKNSLLTVLAENGKRIIALLAGGAGIGGVIWNFPGAIAGIFLASLFTFAETRSKNNG